MARVYKYSLSREDFEKAIQHLSKRVESQNIDIARRVMVDDASINEVAAEFDKTRQHVHKQVISVYEVYARNRVQMPDSWCRVAVSLPPALARQVKVMEKTAIADYLEKLKKLEDHEDSEP